VDRARLASCTSALLLYACAQPEEVDKPTAPTLDEIVAIYRHPTRDFIPADWDAIRADLDDGIAVLERSALVQRLEDALNRTLEQAEQAPHASKHEATPDLLGFVGTGFVRASRICDGWARAMTTCAWTSIFACDRAQSWRCACLWRKIRSWW
jgi:hypothetical protein